MKILPLKNDDFGRGLLTLPRCAKIMNFALNEKKFASKKHKNEELFIKNDELCRWERICVVLRESATALVNTLKEQNAGEEVSFH